MKIKGNSLRLRLIAMAALWCAVALIAAWALLSALFADQVGRGFDEQLAAQLEGVMAASEWGAKGTPGLRRPLPDPRFQQPLSGWYWQISGVDGPLLRSRSLWDATLPKPNETGSGTIFEDFVGPNGTQLRLVARRLTLDEAPDENGGVFLFQLAGDGAAGQADIDRFDRLLAAALVILGLGLIAAMVLQVQIGLRPLAHIGRALAAIRAGRAEQLQGAFPAEIQPLADEIDTLLGHQAAVIGRARAHAGDLHVFHINRKSVDRPNHLPGSVLISVDVQGLSGHQICVLVIRIEFDPPGCNLWNRRIGRVQLERTRPHLDRVTIFRVNLNRTGESRDGTPVLATGVEAHSDRVEVRRVESWAGQDLIIHVEGFSLIPHPYEDASQVAHG